MILQLPEPLWLDTPDGQHQALFVIDRGMESDLEWLVVNDEGELRSYMNYNVRLAKNWTLGRTKTGGIKNGD